MRAVVQRVTSASVSVDGKVIGAIDKGYMVLLGIGVEDKAEDLKYICDKVYNLRVFEDQEGRMNKSLADVGGNILLISQFTLMGDARKGRRPGFDGAMRPEEATKVYQDAIRYFKDTYGLEVQIGEFGADMQVQLVNDGPCTILLDSTKIL